MTADEQQNLIAAAVEARNRAYAPYSNFPVGAALLTKDGRIVTGCNVENSSFGLTTCAERVAVCNAVAAGCKDFAALAIATSGGSPPCGACRQVLAEFCDELPMLLVDAVQHDSLKVYNLSRLLPDGFSITRE